MPARSSRLASRGETERLPRVQAREPQPGVRVSAPRILLIDIETFPDVAYVWGVYDQNAIAVKEHWFMLSAAYRWYKAGRVECLTIEGRKHGDDRALAKSIHALMDEADIIVAHNGVDFDVKKINARLIAHGFTPPSPYKVVDTKRVIKQVAGFSSNKLDWLCKQLGIGHKIEHEGFPLWQACGEQDNPAAWRKMARYNKHDVRLLGDLYELISPWIRQPNAALYHGDERCVNPACRSTDIEFRGLSRQITRTYRRFVCRACGKWGRAVLSERTPRALVVQV